MKGQASVNKKIAKIQSLFTACRDCEAKYLVRGLEGKLRIGLAEQSLLQALAQAAALRALPADAARDALKAEVESCAAQIKAAFARCPDWERAVPALVAGGATGLAAVCTLRPGVPPRPMLAHPARSVSDVFNRLEGEEITCEWKYDGERAQIHIPSAEGEEGGARRDMANAAIFSRNQENSTGKYGDVLARLDAALGPGVASCILDCEVVAWDAANAAILPFQVLSTRRRKAAPEKAGGAGGAGDAGVAVCLFVFDLLHLNGRDLVDDDLVDRRRALREHFTPQPGSCVLAESRECAGPAEVGEWLEEAVRARCEGLMVKTLRGARAKYQVAKRSRAWLKLKKDYLEGGGDSIDAVVVGAWEGRGRRGGALGGFLLACREPGAQEYQALCRLGTGFSDAQLKEFDAQLRALAIPAPKPYYRFDAANAPDVWVEPRLVWEVRCADLTLSPAHCAARGLLGPRGVSLRFPRFVRARPDKRPEEATTARQLADMYLAQDNAQPPPAPDDDDYY